jgi:hypothetical protein
MVGVFDERRDIKRLVFLPTGIAQGFYYLS